MTSRFELGKDSAVYSANWAVTDWFIDGVVGDDSAGGTTVATPIRTGDELLRRLGPYAMWGQSATVHVLANGMTDALILRGAMLVAGTHLDVIGTPTQVADAGTVVTYAAVNHAVPTATEITATGIADWTPYQWRRVMVSSGVRAGTATWVAVSNPGGTGVATARVSPPYRVDAANVNFALQPSIVAVADPIIVETLPVVPVVSILLDGPIQRGAGASWSARQWSVQSVACPQVEISSAASSVANRGVIFGCKLGVLKWNTYVVQSTNGAPNVGGCLIGYQDPCIYTAGYLFLSCLFLGCLIGESVLRVQVQGPIGLSNCLSQGARIVVEIRAAFYYSNLQVFDVPGVTSVAVSLASPSGNNGSNLSGSGNAGYGLGIENNTTLRMANTCNLQAVVSNGRMTTAPATSLTLPQLLLSSDYAQKGVTPAMVAGTIIVTVPWYDNAAQRVTVSHAAFGGTPGILSVQQISTTQFTITSASALDTSTVNWTISPLGRNIFISTV